MRFRKPKPVNPPPRVQIGGKPSVSTSDSRSKKRKVREQRAERRLAQFARQFPYALRPFKRTRRGLYVGGKIIDGGRSRGFQIGIDLVKAGWAVDVLEIFRSNADSFKCFKSPPNAPPVSVICWDVQEISKIMPRHPMYDLTLFWHGPEHIQRDRVKPVLDELAARTRGVLVVGCPLGVYQQGPVDNNEHETHVCHFQPKDIEALGFQTSVIGTEGVEGSNIMGWRVIDPSADWLNPKKA